MMTTNTERIVLAKLGLDDHTRPLYVISKLLRDAGIEVVFLGCYQTPDKVVKTALQEDANAIGLSFHTINYLGWVAEVMELIKNNNATGIAIFVGGIIPESDIPILKQLGVDGIYPTGTPVDNIVDNIKEIIRSKRTLHQ